MNTLDIRRIGGPLILALGLLALFDPRPAAAEAPPALTAAAARAQLDTYLFDAAREGRVEMLQEFVASAYDLDTRDEKGYTALILAAYHGQGAAVDLLLKAGADSCAEDRRGNTALMGAIFKGELSIARKLMAADCAPDHRNAAGQTPAMYAALFQRTEILQALETRGANLSAIDADGNTVEALSRGEFASPLRGP
ncbi:MAG: ankyrin repeat domain-containing protein [Panacagrimonas sp.]